MIIEKEGDGHENPIRVSKMKTTNESVDSVKDLKWEEKPVVSEYIAVE